MRCEECLAVVEEYFDGELDQQTSGAVAAHVAACAECSEALDALGAEQELYASYRREVEPTPALWQAVHARISEKKAEPRASLMERVRDRLAAALSLPILNPALAGSFALVALCALAGWLWFSNVRPSAPAREMAENKVAENHAASTVVSSPNSNVAPPVETSGGPVESSALDTPGRAVNESNKVSQRSTAREASAARAGFSPNDVVAPAQATIEQGVINHEHPTLESVAVAELTTPAPSVYEPTRAVAQSLEDREVARHIEKAQLLLRSFGNMSAGEGEETADVSQKKRLSKELLGEQLVIARDGEESVSVPTKRLLNTLEPFLLDIANLEDKPSKEDVRLIKERMQKKEIIAALQGY